jgi:hypothetical protein
LPAQLFNRLGAVLDWLGLSFADLSEESLFSAVRYQTGLSDWENDFGRLALRVLLKSLEKESNLSCLGRIRMKRECTRLLVNSLRIQEDIKRNPEILDVPIHRPLFIMGLPRTGTTLLHNLLAQDPAARVPVRWELLRPSPPPSIETRDTDSRIKYAENEVRRLRIFAPQVFLIHPLNPTGPDECIHLFKNGFASFSFSMLCNIPQYVDWLFQQNMIPAYSYYCKQLQLLQWRCPGKYWVLKSPSHLFSLDALFTVFPDACVVQAHRDPLKAVASFCSMVTIIRKMYSDQEDLKQIGESCLSLLSMALDRAMKTRETANTHRFCDVNYQELIDDPIGIVKNIYRCFGYDMDPHMEIDMKRWLRNNPQHKSGVHRYSLDQFGLDSYRMKQRFAGYMERFKIRAE